METRSHSHESKPSSSSSQEFHEGDRVVYRPVGHAMQTTVGVIKKIITHTEEAGSRHTQVHASEAEPRYVIENEHTRKETPYKRENIIELATKEEPK